MAPLSVQKRSDGQWRSAPASPAFSASFARRRLLAATPPPRTMRSISNSATARSVGAISMSTTASWKLAAMSAISSRQRSGRLRVR